MKQVLPIIIFGLILVFPGRVWAGHACGNTCDEFTAEGACTHGCGQSGHGGEEYTPAESVPAPLGSDGGNQQQAQQAVQQYNQVVSGNTQVNYNIDASQHQDQATVQDLVNYQRDLAAEVAAVQGQVAAAAEAEVAAAPVPTPVPVPAPTISAAAQATRDAQTARCSQELGLCPMIDPQSLQVVGWVPADTAVFGTYDEAKLARMNVIVGTGYKTVTLDSKQYQAYDFSGETQETSLTGLSPEEVARIKASAEANKVQVDTQGAMVVSQAYDLEEFKQRVNAFYDEQAKIQEKIAATVAINGQPEVLQGHAQACAEQNNGVVCGPDQLWQYVQDKTEVELVDVVNQNNWETAVRDYAGFVERVDTALRLVQQWLGHNNQPLPVQDEGLNLFWEAHPEFFEGLSREEMDAVKNAAKDTVFLIGGYMAKANEALTTDLGQITAECLRIKNGNPLCTKDETYARLSMIGDLPAEYQESVRAEVKRVEAIGGAARDLALVPAAQDPSQVVALKQQEQDIFSQFGLVEAEDKAAARGFAQVIAKDISQAKLERLKEASQAVAEVEQIVSPLESAVAAERNRLIINQDSTSGQRIAQAIIQIADTPLTSAEKISAALDLVRPGCTTDPSQSGCDYLRQNITNIINRLPQFTATARNYAYQNLPDPSQLTSDQIKNLTEFAAVAWRNANPYATVDATTTNLAYLWLKDNCNSVNSAFAPPGCQVFAAKHSLSGAKEELDGYDVALIAQLRCGDTAAGLRLCPNGIDTAKARTGFVDALISQGKTEAEAVQLLRNTQKTQEQIAEITIPGVKDLIHNWEIAGTLAAYSWESIASFFKGSPASKEAGYTVAAAELYELTQGAALRGETFGGHVTTVLGVPILPLCATGTCLLDNGLRIIAAAADTAGNHSGADTLVRLAESVNPTSSVHPIHQPDFLSGGEQVASGILRGIGFAGDLGLALTGTFSYENKLQAAGFGTTEASIDQAHFLAAQTLKENGVSSDSPSYQPIYDSLVETTLAKLPTTESAAKGLNVESIASAAFLSLGPLGAGAREADVLLQSKIVSPLFHWTALIGGGSYAFGGAGFNFTNLLQQNAAQISDLNSLNANPSVDQAMLDKIIKATKVQQNRQTWDAGLQLGATALTQAAFFYSPVKETLFARRTIEVPTEITRSQIADRLGRNDFEIVEVRPVGLSGIEARLAAKKGFTIRDSLNTGDSIKVQPGETFELVIRFTDGTRPDTYPRITPNSESVPVFRYDQGLRDLADAIRSVFRRPTPQEAADVANAAAARPITTDRPLLIAPEDLQGNLLIPPADVSQPLLGGDASTLAPHVRPGQRAVFTPSDGSPRQLVTGNFSGGLTVQTLEAGVTPEQVASLPTTTEVAAAETRVTNQVLARLGEALKAQRGDLVSAVREAVSGVGQLPVAAVNTLATVVKSAVPDVARDLTTDEIALAVEAGDFEALRGWTAQGRTVVAWVNSFIPGEGQREYQALVARFEQARAGNLADEQLRQENAVLTQALAQVHIQAQVVQATVPAASGVSGSVMVKDENGATTNLGDQIGKDGEEGSVYNTGDRQEVAKIFKPDNPTLEIVNLGQSEKLTIEGYIRNQYQDLVSRWEAAEKLIGKEINGTRITYNPYPKPGKLVYDDEGSLLGYTMERIEGETIDLSQRFSLPGINRDSYRSFNETMNSLLKLGLGHFDLATNGNLILDKSGRIRTLDPQGYFAQFRKDIATLELRSLEAIKKYVESTVAAPMVVAAEAAAEAVADVPVIGPLAEAGLGIMADAAQIGTAVGGVIDAALGLEIPAAVPAAEEAAQLEALVATYGETQARVAELAAQVSDARAALAEAEINAAEAERLRQAITAADTELGGLRVRESELKNQLTELSRQAEPGVAASGVLLSPVMERELLTEDEVRQGLVGQIDGFSSREEFYGRVHLLAEAIESQYPADFPVMVRFSHEGGISQEESDRMMLVDRVKVADLEEELMRRFREFEAGKGAPADRTAVIFIGRSEEFIAQFGLDRWAKPGDRQPDLFSKIQPAAISRQNMLFSLGISLRFGSVGQRLAVLADWVRLQLHKPGELPRGIAQRQVIEGGKIWLEQMGEGEAWTIGRQDEAVIKFGSRDISRQHALMRRDKDSYLLADVGSTFGTVIYRPRAGGSGFEQIILEKNGKFIRLNEGDVIQLGSHIQMRLVRGERDEWYLDGPYSNDYAVQLEVEQQQGQLMRELEELGGRYELVQGEIRGINENLAQVETERLTGESELAELRQQLAALGDADEALIAARQVLEDREYTLNLGIELLGKAEVVIEKQRELNQYLATLRGQGVEVGVLSLTRTLAQDTGRLGVALADLIGEAVRQQQLADKAAVVQLGKLVINLVPGADWLRQVWEMGNVANRALLALNDAAQAIAAAQERRILLEQARQLEAAGGVVIEEEALTVDELRELVGRTRPEPAEAVPGGMAEPEAGVSRQPGDLMIAGALSNIRQNPSVLDAQLEEQGHTILYEAGNAVAVGAYDPLDLTDALNRLTDPYGIFPALSEALTPGMSNAEMIDTTSRVVEQQSRIPVRIVAQAATREVPFYTFSFQGKTYGMFQPFVTDDPQRSGRGYQALAYELVQNLTVGQAKSLNDAHNRDSGSRPSYEPSPYRIDEAGGRVFAVEGAISAIFVNGAKITEDSTLRTIAHELGHVVEQTAGTPLTKEPYQRVTTEVVASLYGIRFAQIIAPFDLEKAVRIGQPQIELFNYVLHGTVVPSVSAAPAEPTGLPAGVGQMVEGLRDVGAAIEGRWEELQQGYDSFVLAVLRGQQLTQALDEAQDQYRNSVSQAIKLAEDIRAVGGDAAQVTTAIQATSDLQAEALRLTSELKAQFGQAIDPLVFDTWHPVLGNLEGRLGRAVERFEASQDPRKDLISFITEETGQVVVPSQPLAVLTASGEKFILNMDNGLGQVFLDALRALPERPLVIDQFVNHAQRDRFIARAQQYITVRYGRAVGRQVYEYFSRPQLAKNSISYPYQAVTLLDPSLLADGQLAAAVEQLKAMYEEMVFKQDLTGNPYGTYGTLTLAEKVAFSQGLIDVVNRLIGEINDYAGRLPGEPAPPKGGLPPSGGKPEAPGAGGVPPSAKATGGESPLAQTPAVPITEGLAECVTGDTKLRRRRRKKGGREEWEEVPIKEIKLGDEILTLDETTGRLVTARVKQLLAKGKQRVYKLKTASGKMIRTTSTHPYLALPQSVLSASRIAVFIDAANLQKSAQRLGWQVHYRRLERLIATLGDLTYLGYYTVQPKTLPQRIFLRSLRRFGYDVVSKPLKVIRDEHNKSIRKANFDVEIAVEAMDKIGSYDNVILFSGDSDFNFLVKKLRKYGKKVTVISTKYSVAKELVRSADRFIDLEDLVSEVSRRSQKSPSFATGDKSSLATAGESVLNVTPFVKGGKWTKVSALRPGQMVAVAGGNQAVFEVISSIEEVGREEVYDIEVEGTHNFVGNGIVAHNTSTPLSAGTKLVAPDLATEFDQAKLGQALERSLGQAAADQALAALRVWEAGVAGVATDAQWQALVQAKLIDQAKDAYDLAKQKFRGRAQAKVNDVFSVEFLEARAEALFEQRLQQELMAALEKKLGEISVVDEKMKLHEARPGFDQAQVDRIQGAIYKLDLYGATEDDWQDAWQVLAEKLQPRAVAPVAERAVEARQVSVAERMGQAVRRALGNGWVRVAGAATGVLVPVVTVAFTLGNLAGQWFFRPPQLPPLPPPAVQVEVVQPRGEPEAVAEAPEAPEVVVEVPEKKADTTEQQSSLNTGLSMVSQPVRVGNINGYVAIASLSTNNLLTVVPDDLRKPVNRLVGQDNDVVLEVNANFFDVTGDGKIVPIGLFGSNGQVRFYRPTRTGAGLWSLILDSLGNKAVVKTDEVTNVAELEFAVTGTPALIKDGEALPLPDWIQVPMFRTAVGINRAGKLVIISTDSVTGSQLQSALLEMGVVDAVNLDGGSTSRHLFVLNNGEIEERMESGDDIATPTLGVKQATLIEINKDSGLAFNDLVIAESNVAVAQGLIFDTDKILEPVLAGLGEADRITQPIPPVKLSTGQTVEFEVIGYGYGDQPTYFTAGDIETIKQVVEEMGQSAEDLPEVIHIRKFAGRLPRLDPNNRGLWDEGVYAYSYTEVSQDGKMIGYLHFNDGYRDERSHLYPVIGGTAVGYGSLRHEFEHMVFYEVGENGSKQESAALRAFRELANAGLIQNLDINRTVPGDEQIEDLADVLTLYKTAPEWLRQNYPVAYRFAEYVDGGGKDFAALKQELAKEGPGTAGNLALPLPAGLVANLWQHRWAVRDIASEFVLGKKKAGLRASGVVKSWWEKNSKHWWKALGDLDRQLRQWEQGPGPQGQNLKEETTVFESRVPAPKGLVRVGEGWGDKIRRWWENLRGVGGGASEDQQKLERLKQPPFDPGSRRVLMLQEVLKGEYFGPDDFIAGEKFGIETIVWDADRSVNVYTFDPNLPVNAFRFPYRLADLLLMMTNPKVVPIFYRTIDNTVVDQKNNDWFALVLQEVRKAQLVVEKALLNPADLSVYDQEKLKFKKPYTREELETLAALYQRILYVHGLAAEDDYGSDKLSFLPGLLDKVIRLHSQLGKPIDLTTISLLMRRGNELSQVEKTLLNDYARVAEHLHILANSDEDLTLPMVYSAHDLLLEHEVKEAFRGTTRQSFKIRNVATAVPSGQTEERLGELVRQWNELSRKYKGQASEVAQRAFTEWYNRFLSDHVLLDGNGRMGMLLLGVLQQRAGLPVFWPDIDKRTYIDLPGKFFVDAEGKDEQTLQKSLGELTELIRQNSRLPDLSAVAKSVNQLVGGGGPATTTYNKTGPEEQPRGLVRVGEGWAEQFTNWLADKQPRWYQRWNTVLYQLQQWGIYQGEIVHESYEFGLGPNESKGLGGASIDGSYLGFWVTRFGEIDALSYWEKIVGSKQAGEELVVVDLGSGAGNFGRDLGRLWADPQAEIEVPERLKPDLERFRRMVIGAKDKGLRLRYVGITDTQIG